MDANIGKFLGKYQILEPLGEGGMATVYKAYDASLERHVAIKIIRTMNQIDPNFLARFQREAKALAKLDHPYILKVLDYGEQDGIPYLVMPFVSRGTLKQYTRTQLPYQKAIQLVLPIAEALSFAHQRKIIHRDIKPANILFGESGEPVLSDFGIAKMIDTGDETQLTRAGIGIGTPDYMAPEQWNGVADERTDVYALGIVLYELITGRCPFHADTPAAILMKQVQDPLPRPKIFVPQLSDVVEGLLIKALAKDPQLRFQNMQEFIQAMNRVTRGESRPDEYSGGTIASGGIGQTAVSRSSSTTAYPVSGTTVQKESGRKWLPWVIGVGGIFTTACLIIAVITGLYQFGVLSKKTPTEMTGAFSTQSNGEEVLDATEPAGEVLTSKETATSQILQTTTMESVEVIDKLPDDIPVFTPNNGDVMITENEQMRTFNYSSASDHTEVEDFFVQEMVSLGWELVSTSEMSAQNLMGYIFSKDTRSAVVYIIDYVPSDKPAFTMIQIMLEK